MITTQGVGMATEPSAPRRKLSAIVMVDVSGFSRLMGQDEEGATARIREFHSRIRSIVQTHEGWVVDTAGDSVFGEFDSVVNAVRCAQAIQDGQAAVNASRPPEEHIETRIGVHLGDVIVQDYQVYGDGVTLRPGYRRLRILVLSVSRRQFTSRSFRSSTSPLRIWVSRRSRTSSTQSAFTE
jgi:class 3 adenylate cyclase